MKIALYAGSWPPRSDATGITTYIASIVPALRQAGHEVFILTHGSSDEHIVDIDCFAKPLSLKQKLLRRFFPTMVSVRARRAAISEAARYLVDRKRVTVLEIEESFGLSLAVSSLRILPVVVRLHGPWFLNSNGGTKIKDRLREHREGRAIRRASFVTAPSKYVLDRTIDRYKLNQVFKREVPTALIANPIPSRQRKWELHGCVKKQFLFVGRFDTIKGGDLVLEAFAKLAEDDQQVTLVFVGPDLGIGGRRFFEFVRSKLAPSISNRVRYLGILPRDEIDQLRLSSFAIIFASRMENFAYTILEAMALGCPIIAAAAGGTVELIEHRNQGLLFESGSSDKLASCMAELLVNHQLACQLAEGARKQAALYAPEMAAARTIECYQGAISDFKAKR